MSVGKVVAELIMKAENDGRSITTCLQPSAVFIFKTPVGRA